MDLNQLAVAVSRIEGKKIPVNIAQIKEVLNCLGQVLRNADPVESSAVVASLIAKGGVKGKRKR